MAVAAVGVLQCQKCDAMSKIATLSGCGHHFCISCLESQHDDWTAESKQPCQHCFKLNVPPRVKDVKDHEPDDKLRPCKVWGQSPMVNERLRETIVQLGIQALEKYEDYFERAKYVGEELNRTESGYWACITRHSTVECSKSESYYTYFGKGKIYFRVGETYFDVFKQGQQKSEFSFTFADLF